LLGLIEAIPINVAGCFNVDGSYRSVFVDYGTAFRSLIAREEFPITNGDKHTALAQTVLEVAAQVGGFIRDKTMKEKL
jgi:hypothetical protein